MRIRELYERQAQQDVLTLGIVIDEYIRLIGSVKTAFTQRQKTYQAWHAADSELQKRKSAQDKLLRQGKTQRDRLDQVGAEVAEAEKRVHQSRLLFEDLGRLMRTELERFEKEKVEDFKSGVETFLESAVEAQKEVRSFLVYRSFSSYKHDPHAARFSEDANPPCSPAYRALGDLSHAIRRGGGRRTAAQSTRRSSATQLGRAVHAAGSSGKSAGSAGDRGCLCRCERRARAGRMIFRPTPASRVATRARSRMRKPCMAANVQISQSFTLNSLHPKSLQTLVAFQVRCLPKALTTNQPDAPPLSTELA